MDQQHVSTAELTGRLGQKPYLKRTDDGVPYVQLSLATADRFTNDVGAIQERTDWHRAVAWGPVAEHIAGTFDKGDSVTLSGAMRINTYEKDGQKNRVTELQVEKAEPSQDKRLSKNEVRIVGTAREDAKTLHTAAGASLTVVSMATRVTRDGRQREDWHRVALWGKNATAAQDLKAGDTIAVDGALRHDTITGPDGKERRISSIDARQFQVLERGLAKAVEPLVRRNGKVLDRGM
jgi:single-strand DNA-binding protein